MPPFFVSNADRLNGVSPITTSHFHLQSHCTMATIGITKQKQGSHRRNQSRQDGSNSRAKVGTGYGVHKVLTPEEIVMKKFIGKQRRYWRSPRGQNTARVLPVLAVAGVALVVSYGHIYHVVHHAGETPLTAAIIPFSVDGLLITSARYIGHTRTWAGRCWAANRM